MDATPIYAWLIRGLGGAVNVLEGMCREGAVLTPHWQEVLSKITDQLIGICESQTRGPK